MYVIASLRKHTSNIGTNDGAVILLVRTVALWRFDKYLITFVALTAIQLIVRITTSTASVENVHSDHSLFSFPNSPKFIIVCIIGSHSWNVSDADNPTVSCCIARTIMLMRIPVSSHSSKFGCFTGVESRDAWPAFFGFVCVEIC